MEDRAVKGKVFDIRRFSTHDGAGIRTTVFLKGCPLRCVWCQNPEGIDREIRPVYFAGKCIHCGTCLSICRDGGVCEKAGELHLCREREENWEALIDACPSGAIVMDAKECGVGELVTELMKDEVFFRQGGGVTLSGGEPLGQPEFAIEVLRRLKEQGVHTAVETALQVPEETVKRAFPYLDQVYADLKLADEKEHKNYTGVSNLLIKRNLSYILSSEYRTRVIVRTPLIPGFTASEKNLAEIARWLSAVYPEVKYELLNYNPLAEAKYRLVDREYCFQENPKLYTKEQMEAFGEIVKEHGITNLIMEI